MCLSCIVKKHIYRASVVCQMLSQTYLIATQYSVFSHFLLPKKMRKMQFGKLNNLSKVWMFPTGLFFLKAWVFGYIFAVWVCLKINWWINRIIADVINHYIDLCHQILLIIINNNWTAFKSFLTVIRHCAVCYKGYNKIKEERLYYSEMLKIGEGASFHNWWLSCVWLEHCHSSDIFTKATFLRLKLKIKIKHFSLFIFFLAVSFWIAWNFKFSPFSPTHPVLNFL